MTNELQKLYDFIAGREATTVKDICDEFPYLYTLNAKESNFSNCPKLYKDIDLINSDCEIEKIIIKDNNNFHLATEEEAKVYRNKLFIQGKKYMAKYGCVMRKMLKNGQADIMSLSTAEQSALMFVNTFAEEKQNDAA